MIVLFFSSFSSTFFNVCPLVDILSSFHSVYLKCFFVCHQQGYCKYSFLFYGYYNDERTIGVLKFRLPLSYLLVGVGIFGYSLMVVIRT